MKANIFALALAGALATSATASAAFDSVFSQEASFTFPGAQLVDEEKGSVLIAPGSRP